MEIVNGYTGTENVTAAMDGNLYAGAFGMGCYVLDVGKKLACTVASSNSVTIADGSLVMFGRHGYIKAGSTQTLSVTSGTTGYKRNDIVAAHYTADSSTGIEKIDLVVLNGTPTTGTPADPSYSSNSILSGSTDSYMPLWRLPLDGITIGTPVRLFTFSPSLASLGDSVSQSDGVTVTDNTSVQVMVSRYGKAVVWSFAGTITWPGTFASFALATGLPAARHDARYPIAVQGASNLGAVAFADGSGNLIVESKGNSFEGQWCFASGTYIAA